MQMREPNIDVPLFFIFHSFGSLFSKDALQENVLSLPYVVDQKIASCMLMVSAMPTRNT